MPLKTMNDLFVHGLKDIYYAEKKLVVNLPKMAKKAQSSELGVYITAATFDHLFSTITTSLNLYS